MQGRQERVLIPSTIALFSMVITLWAGAGFNHSPFTWFPFIQQSEGQWLKIISTIGIANLGIGFICQAIVTSLFFHFPGIRFINEGEDLFEAFGIDCTDYSKKEIRKELREVLLAEFHARLHSHAPQSLTDFCSRRNSAWYIALNSAVATILGLLFAVVVMMNHVGCCSSLCNYLCPTGLLLTSLLLLAFTIILGMQGYRWNKEFWDVGCKWIYWDLQTHKPDKNWWCKELARRDAAKSRRAN